MAVLTDRTLRFFKHPTVTRSSKVPNCINWQLSSRSSQKYDFFTPRSYNTQILLDLWKQYSTKERPIWPFEIGFDITTKDFTKSITTKHLVDIFYVNRSAIDALLGSQEKPVLERVVNLVQDTAHEEKWPLTKIEIQLVKDLEITDSEHILMVLYFDTDFDTANKYLYKYYDKLDILTDIFNKEEQDILRRLFFFDVKT